MNDPIKIIWKYKNNNKKIQYNQYIFVGKINDNIMKILNKFKDLDLYNTFVELSLSEIKLLEEQYGEFWYSKFFNYFNMISSIKNIINDNERTNFLRDKFGQSWFDNLQSYQKINKRPFYSYSSLIHNEKVSKISKKELMQEHEQLYDIDYRLKKSQIGGKKKSEENLQFKKILDRINPREPIDAYDDIMESKIESKAFREFGEYPMDIDEPDFATTLDPDKKQELAFFGGSRNEEDNSVEFQNILPNDEILENPENIEEEIELESIENIDENLSITADLIKKAFDDENIIKEVKEDVITFDKSKIDDIYDASIDTIYKKQYVTIQYIFKDDTIKNIKNKITCGIKHNFDIPLIPSRQYLWSVYMEEKKIDKIMIGQKWVTKTDLLKIDTEPVHNLYIFEELNPTLIYLRDNLKKYSNKIKRDDDENNILFDYTDYILNNDIYMIDIYNELGKNYSPNQIILKNLEEIYFKIYFPKIKPDQIKDIINFLNDNKKEEEKKILNVYDTLNNDLIIENKITNLIENIKLHENYKPIFLENFITQTIIHVQLKQTTGTNMDVDMYKIFNNFIVSEEYPFIQYQNQDGKIIFKFDKSEITNYINTNEHIELLIKWFENTTYGVTFKLKTTIDQMHKFNSITINSKGRVEYKTQWKEDEHATIKNIYNVYENIKIVIGKINNECGNIFEIPKNEEFKYAFINSIQKFKLPENFIINHNDLSDFSRYFFPYIALVVEPRKRESKKVKNVIGKFGTYLRFKRVSKYENETKIEQRILYLMRNYDYSEQTLTLEIAKQFNITEQKSSEFIKNIIAKYPRLKKSRKILKSLETIPKSKPPGINIDIQGKNVENYKIRISGARDKGQLDRILVFINILLYLYGEIFIFKNKKYISIKEQIKKLTNIAKRRNKVNDFVKYSDEIKQVKLLQKIDKKRLGFKPEKGQNQWSRSCQNSGDDVKRQPGAYTSGTGTMNNMNELIKLGYKFNKNTGNYERTIKTKNKKDIILRTIKIKEVDKNIFYACNPEFNKEHMYVGFLTKSKNPTGLCMPCCFKKNPLESKTKLDFYKKCAETGKYEYGKNEDEKIIGEVLYILHDTNKIYNGRYSYLEKYLDTYFNLFTGKKIIIKNHYLIETAGYFLKYGIYEPTNFLSAISSIFDMTIDNIKKKIEEKLSKDINGKYFTSLNNGNIKNEFQTKEKYFEFIDTENLNHYYVNDILSIPDVLSEHGVNIIIFEHIKYFEQKKFERKKEKHDFKILCQVQKSITNIYDKKKTNIFILMEDKNYYPIFLVKKNKKNKDLSVIKQFNYEEDKDNIVYYVSDYYSKNCLFMNDAYKLYNITANDAFDLYKELILLPNKEFHPKNQIIDNMNKVKYLVLKNNLMLPTNPSGSIYFLNISLDTKNYILSFEETLEKLEELKNLLDNDKLIPTGIYYDKKENNNVNMVSIKLRSFHIPIISKQIGTEILKSKKLSYEKLQLHDKIDNLLGKKTLIIDERVDKIGYNNYINEGYELFKYEFSEFITKTLKPAEKIKKIIMGKENNENKLLHVQRILFKLLNKKLHNLFTELYGKKKDSDITNKYNTFVRLINKTPNTDNYVIKNEREICKINTDENKCSNNIHCQWNNNECKIALEPKILASYIAQLSSELITNNITYKEVFKIDNHFISEIVDRNKFTKRPNQVILSNMNTELKSILKDIFKEQMPKINIKKKQQDELVILQLNINNPIKDLNVMYVQRVMNDGLSLLRAYTNSIYWIHHHYNNINDRNLGYYSITQTNLAYYFKNTIVEWLNNKKNYDIIKKKLFNYMEIRSIDEIYLYINKINKISNIMTNCITELYVLNIIKKIPIVVFNDVNNIIYVFDEDIITDNFEDKYKQNKDFINIKFTFLITTNIPNHIDVLMFK